MTEAKRRLVEVGANEIEAAVLELLRTCPAKAILRRAVDKFLDQREVSDPRDDKIKAQVMALLRKHAYRPTKKIRVRDPFDDKPKAQQNKLPPWILRVEDCGLSYRELQREVERAAEWVKDTPRREEREMKAQEAEERRERAGTAA
jgi:hypothetical protein